MSRECLPFTAIPHTSRLFLDYLYQFERVERFYAANPLDRASLPAFARGAQYDNGRRGEVAGVLRVQNAGFGADERALANVERFRRGAYAVVTGQQVGLFGGPLYAVLKAVSAIALADELTRQGLDAIPVFWLATEDHDLDEVTKVTLLTPEGALETLRTESHGPPDAPMSDVPLGDDVPGLIERAAALLNDSDIAAALQHAYRPGETLGTAFGRLFADLLSGRGLVLLDPADPELHRLSQPIYLSAAMQAEELDAALLARGRELTEAGYHVQVKVTPASTLLFQKRDGARVTIRRSNSGFAAGPEKFSTQELQDRIERAPERFSANVLLRPVQQDFLMPTVAYIGGPAEVAYFAQAGVVYEKLLGRVTPVLPRLSATLVDARAQRLLRKYGIGLADLFHGHDATRELLGTRSLPPELHRQFEAGAQAVASALDGIRESLRVLAPTLVNAAQRTGSKVTYQFERLRKRAALAEVRRNAEVERHARWLSDNLYPAKGLQERDIGGLSFLARHGRQLLDALHEAARAGCPDHQIIHL
jgi:bacillithiol biosynthesis cysteine-adding enzyme BshC